MGIVLKKRGRPAQRDAKNLALERALTIVGSTKRLALEIGVHSNTVSDWLYRERKIPAHHVHKIVHATRGAVKAEELRPDVFVSLESLEIE